MSTTQRPVAFISHASSDAKMAVALCEWLEQRGIPCWIAPRNVTPGKDYGAEIIGAMDEVRAVVLLMSRHANESKYVRNEIERAVSKEKRLYPFFIEDVAASKSLEFFISSAHWIRADKAGFDAAAGQLAQALSAETGIAVEAPEGAPGRTLRRGWGAGVLGIVAALAIAAGGWTMWRQHRAPAGKYRGEETPAPAAAAPAVVMPTYNALVIGINDYQNAPPVGWDSLNTARRDAEAVADTLERSYGFTVQRLMDRAATRAAIMAGLDQLASGHANQAALIYYAGHGFYEAATDEGFWIPSDARRREGQRDTKEDWIWNSTISKIVDSSSARHVLIIADSCYGGSLFRGEEPVSERQLTWYRRAIEKPSRYLITSGDLELVMDSGGQHSVFAQQLLNYLEHTDRTVFSASDLGQSVREKVSSLTGQLVRMGQLPVGSHAGGEFVFTRGEAAAPALLAAAGATTGSRGDRGPSAVADAPSPAAPPAPERTTAGALQDALTLYKQGATNSAQRLVGSLLSDTSEKLLVKAVAEHFDAKSREAGQLRLRALIERLEQRKAAAGTNGTAAQAAGPRPRILACVGPTDRRAGTDDAMADLFRICLRTELGVLGRDVVVEREALQDVLTEVDLGSSELADSRARIAIGKLLPASLLLLGDILPGAGGQGVPYLRLVDTETTRIVASFGGELPAGQSLPEMCRNLAAQISAGSVTARPLEAPVLSLKNDVLGAGLGSFHGVAQGAEFAVLRAEGAQGAGREVGRATVQSLTETSCELNATWTEAPSTPDIAGLSIREIAPALAQSK